MRMVSLKLCTAAFVAELIEAGQLKCDEVDGGELTTRQPTELARMPRLIQYLQLFVCHAQ